MQKDSWAVSEACLCDRLPGSSRNLFIIVANMIPSHSCISCATRTDNPGAAANIVKDFKEMTILQDAGFLFTTEVVYDVCRKCYDIYRGPEEATQPATHCRRCDAKREDCLKFLYRCGGFGATRNGHCCLFQIRGVMCSCPSLCKTRNLLLRFAS